MPGLGEIAQALIALTVLFNGWQSYKNGQRAKGISADVKEVITATNGLTQKLVKVTGEAEFAKGVEAGRNGH